MHNRQEEREEWLRGVKAIADFLGVSDRTVERWIVTDETDFPIYKCGGRWAAHTGDLRRWQRLRGRSAA